MRNVIQEVHSYENYGSLRELEIDVEKDAIRREMLIRNVTLSANTVDNSTKYHAIVVLEEIEMEED